MSTHVKMPHCWKSHVTAHINFLLIGLKIKIITLYSDKNIHFTSTKAMEYTVLTVYVHIILF